MTSHPSRVGPSGPTLSLQGSRESVPVHAAGCRGQEIPGAMACPHLTALEAAEQRGADDLGVASHLNQLAKLYRESGEDAQAEPLLERALVIEEKVLGPVHPQVAITLTDLMYLYRRQGRERAAAAAAARATHILAAQARGGYEARERRC